MPSAWSMALRQTPGRAAAAPTSSVAAPTIAIPSLPQMPSIDDARAPNAAGRTWIGQQLGALPGRYTPIIDQARVNARASLAGYGGVTISDDNRVTFDPNARLGQKEKQAVQGEENAANARGLLFSSFANQNIGAALVRMNEEKRAIVNQFAASINNTLMGQASEAGSLVGDWVRMYGEDSRYLLENPPPAPPMPVYVDPNVQRAAEAPQAAGFEPDIGGGWTPPAGTRREIVRNPPQSQIAALRKQGYKKAGASWGKNVWVKAY